MNAETDGAESPLGKLDNAAVELIEHVGKDGNDTRRGDGLLIIAKMFHEYADTCVVEASK